jgi:hypothetical protein
MSRKWHKLAAPHRRLNRRERGEDVRRFQIGLEARLDHDPERTLPHVKPDGVFGDATLRAWRRVAHLIGLPDGHPPTRRAQLNVRQPWTRTPAARRRAKARRATMGTTAGERAVEALGKYLGKTESGNRAPWLDALARKFVGPWMVGQPWCGLACIVGWAGAGVALPKDTVSTVACLHRARRGDGFRLVPASKAAPGDLVLMDFAAGGDEVQHVGLARGPMRNGLIPTREGNTSPGAGGSQNNGGGVYDRVRPASVVRAVARPIH